MLKAIDITLQTRTPMSDEPMFHFDMSFDHDRTCSTSSHKSVDEECEAFIEEAKDIRAMVWEMNAPKEILKFFRSRPDIIMPRKASRKSVGWDLYTLPNFNCMIPVGQSRLIPLGIAFGFPDGYYGQLVSRSGLAFQDGIYVQGGVIDPDYDGDIHVLLHNFGKRTFHVNSNMRICQMVLLRYSTINDLVEVAYSKQLRNRFLEGTRL